jgi:RimJ/RimL family protein N-acetyltransferase
VVQALTETASPVRFGAIEHAHLGSLKDWRNEQMAVLRQTKPLTDEDQERWFQFIQTDSRQRLFSILDLNGLFVGYCGLTNIDAPNRRGEVTFLVDTKFSDAEYRDVFLQTLEHLCGYGFGTLKLHKVFAEAFEFRTQTISILEAYGFERTGRLRDHIWEFGRFFDSVILSILNPSDGLGEPAPDVPRLR